MSHPYDKLVFYDPAVSPEEAAKVTYTGMLTPEVLPDVIKLQNERSLNAYAQLQILSQAMDYWDEFRTHCAAHNLVGSNDDEH